jgi:hypothetical protein
MMLGQHSLQRINIRRSYHCPHSATMNSRGTLIKLGMTIMRILMEEQAARARLFWIRRNSGTLLSRRHETSARQRERRERYGRLMLVTNKRL